MLPVYVGSALHYCLLVLRERSPPSWIRTNPLLMPHIPQYKSNKIRESPTYCINSCQYGDKAPLKPYISRGGGIGVYFDWCIAG